MLGGELSTVGVVDFVDFVVVVVVNRNTRSAQPPANVFRGQLFTSNQP